METFGALLSKTLSLFRVEFVLWGYTISFWQIFVFSAVIGVVCWILREVFLGD